MCKRILRAAPVLGRLCAKNLYIAGRTATEPSTRPVNSVRRDNGRPLPGMNGKPLLRHVNLCLLTSTVYSFTEHPCGARGVVGRLTVSTYCEATRLPVTSISRTPRRRAKWGEQEHKLSADERTIRFHKTAEERLCTLAGHGVAVADLDEVALAGCALQLLREVRRDSSRFACFRNVLRSTLSKRPKSRTVNGTHDVHQTDATPEQYVSGRHNSGHAISQQACLDHSLASH